jgi:DNA uptake protein ComE-like DNA-binding protein
MTWYRFDWNSFVTEDLLAQLGSPLGGAELAALRVRVAPLVARLLEVQGGPAVAPRTYDPAERTQVALRLVQTALEHALAGVRAREIPGVVFEEAGTQPPRVKAARRVQVNRAPLAEIEALPGVGLTLARRVVAARQRRPFDSLDDFTERVEGIGTTKAKRLAKALDFRVPPVLPGVPITGNFASDWASLLAAHPHADPILRLETVLELLLQHASQNRNPAVPVLLDPAPAAPTALAFTAEQVTVLFGSTYYQRLVSLFDQAAQQIDVCMFHIAMPKANHPTRHLLDALIRAQQRGVAVRVLVDRDRAEDPYLSTIINQAALTYLSQGGVAVRQDQPDTLLHSKYLLIDSDLVLMGSHNWSAGSYFQFDDLTLMVRSAEMTAAQRQRFDYFWNQ